MTCATQMVFDAIDPPDSVRNEREGEREREREKERQRASEREREGARGCRRMGTASHALPMLFIGAIRISGDGLSQP